MMMMMVNVVMVAKYAVSFQQDGDDSYDFVNVIRILMTAMTAFTTMVLTDVKMIIM